MQQSAGCKVSKNRTFEHLLDEDRALGNVPVDGELLVVRGGERDHGDRNRLLDAESRYGACGREGTLRVVSLVGLNYSSLQRWSVRASACVHAPNHSTLPQTATATPAKRDRLADSAARFNSIKGSSPDPTKTHTHTHQWLCCPV